MCFAGNAYYHGTLLHCFGCILDLEYTALRRAVCRVASAKLFVVMMLASTASRGRQGRLKGSQTGNLQCHRVVVVIVSEHGGRKGVVVASSSSSIKLPSISCRGLNGRERERESRGGFRGCWARRAAAGAVTAESRACG